MSAARSGEHDDFVIVVALAVWGGVAFQRGFLLRSWSE